MKTNKKIHSIIIVFLIFYFVPIFVFAKTYRNIGIIILLLGSIISYLIYNKKKIQTQK